MERSELIIRTNSTDINGNGIDGLGSPTFQTHKYITVGKRPTSPPVSPNLERERYTSPTIKGSVQSPGSNFGQSEMATTNFNYEKSNGAKSDVRGNLHFDQSHSEYAPYTQTGYAPFDQSRHSPTQIGYTKFDQSQSGFVHFDQSQSGHAQFDQSQRSVAQNGNLDQSPLGYVQVHQSELSPVQSRKVQFEASPDQQFAKVESTTRSSSFFDDAKQKFENYFAVQDDNENVVQGEKEKSFFDNAKNKLSEVFKTDNVKDGSKASEQDEKEGSFLEEAKNKFSGIFKSDASKDVSQEGNNRNLLDEAKETIGGIFKSDDSKNTNLHAENYEGNDKGFLADAKDALAGIFKIDASKDSKDVDAGDLRKKKKVPTATLR